MPGGLPGIGPPPDASGGGGGGGGGRSCVALGEGAEGRRLSPLRDAIKAPGYVQKCQALSGVLSLLGVSGRRLRTCAVVGGSGILRRFPRGHEIDNAEAIFRVNNCPVAGFEDMVGGRTSVRFLNSPRSLKWAGEVARLRGTREERDAKVPPELKNNDHVVVWGSDDTRQRLANALPDGSSVVRANTAFRKHCAAKAFWHSDELAAHKKGGARIFEITFGFEAVAHALFACDRVKIYGYYLGDKDRHRQTNAQGSAAMETPYHYYENRTYDKAAKDPWRPWTYSYHNFSLEHAKYRQLHDACWLTNVHLKK